MTNRVNVRANTGQLLQLYVLDCANCGVVFGITTDYEARRRDDGRDFHCPNGHSNAWTETEADREKKRADRLRTQLIAAQDQRWAAERDAEMAKAREVRLRWRVGNGVCPCCSRTFPELASHVATKHPDFLTRDLSDLSSAQVRTLAALRAATDEKDDALVDPYEAGADWRSVRALARRGLVTAVAGEGVVALTEAGWPLAEQAAAAQ